MNGFLGSKIVFRRKNREPEFWRLVLRHMVNGDSVVLLAKPRAGFIVRVYHGNLAGESEHYLSEQVALQRFQDAARAAIEKPNE